jgi:hypothetical protein
MFDKGDRRKPADKWRLLKETFLLRLDISTPLCEF